MLSTGLHLTSESTEGRPLPGQIFDHEVGGYTVAGDFRGKLFVGNASQEACPHKRGEGAEPCERPRCRVRGCRLRKECRVGPQLRDKLAAEW